MSDGAHIFAGPPGEARTPCGKCGAVICVQLRSTDELNAKMRAAGAVFDHVWFCGPACRDAFNVDAPANSWDRVEKAIVNIADAETFLHMKALARGIELALAAGVSLEERREEITRLLQWIGRLI